MIEGCSENSIRAYLVGSAGRVQNLTYFTSPALVKNSISCSALTCEDTNNMFTKMHKEHIIIILDLGELNIFLVVFYIFLTIFYSTIDNYFGITVMYFNIQNSIKLQVKITYW